MTKNHKNILTVESKNPPVVELDSASHSAYVRFSNNKVRRTVVVSVRSALVTADLDAAGAVIGVELVGVKSFTLGKLVKEAGLRGVSENMLRNATYVPANAELVAC
jgi:hypothetical protein